MRWTRTGVPRRQGNGQAATIATRNRPPLAPDPYVIGKPA